MNCPKCKEPMIVLEINEVEIDHCLSCKGVWLDGGELELLLETANKKNELLSSFEIDKETKEEKRRCPICLKYMEKVLCGESKKNCIDRCRKGDGLWFDMGELHAIVKTGYFDKDSKVLKFLEDIFGNKVKE